MSLLNIGLQGIGIMRTETATCECYLKTANNLSQIRSLQNDHPNIVDEVRECMRPTKELMESVLKRLSLKDKQLITFNAATLDEINQFCSVLKKIDDQFDIASFLNPKKPLKSVGVKFEAFFKKHCKEAHYLFSVKKCGEPGCICGTAQLSSGIFKTIHHLPDPEPAKTNPEKYACFQDLYGKVNQKIVDVHLPSKNSKGKEHGMPFSPSAQVAKNTKLVLQCEECLRWRCVYSKQKISKVEKSQAMQLFELISYSCGASLQDVVEFSGDVTHIYCQSNRALNSYKEYSGDVSHI